MKLVGVSWGGDVPKIFISKTHRAFFLRGQQPADRTCFCFERFVGGVWFICCSTSTGMVLS